MPRSSPLPSRTGGTDRAGHHAVVRDHGFHPLRVTGIVDETADTRSFALDVPERLGDTFRYRPGQFCTFRVRIGCTEHLRSYSMSSAPETDGDLAVTVKRVPGGVVSNWFNDRLSVGDAVEATRPAGVFCPRATDRPVAALCGGSGVTPVMSIIKSELAATGRPIRLLYANRDRRSVIFHEELMHLQAAYPRRLDIVFHLDASSGLPDAGTIAGFAAPTPDADFYICGPGAFMDRAGSALADLHVDADRVFVERFVVDRRTTIADHLDRGPTGTERPAAVTVLLRGKAATITYHPGDTVLETARRGGLSPPSSCEAGDCATCMAIVREGAATMRVNNALTPAEVDEGWILTCQAFPRGHAVTVEYEAL